jgi:phosphoserine aminotransferase
MGGIEYYIQLANQRGKLLWDFVESTNGYFWSKITDKKYRSRINVIMRIQDKNEAMEAKFIEEA